MESSNVKIWFDQEYIEPIKICNLKNKKILTEPWEVRVDRSSVLGNPYILKTERYRDIVCENYKFWLTKEIKNGNMNIINELNRLLNIYVEYGKLHLYCHCFPKRCHGEIVSCVVYEMLKDK